MPEGSKMNAERISGVLLHVTSLPSFGGVGDFGPAAYGFVDFLAAAKQRLWQVLPLSPTGYGSSPYSALSAFAGNPLLISLEFLVRDGWLTQDRLDNVPGGLPGHEGPCDFGTAFAKKIPLIEEAAANFLDRAPAGRSSPLPALLPGQHRLAHRLRHLHRPSPPLQLPQLERVALRVSPAASPTP